LANVIASDIFVVNADESGVAQLTNIPDVVEDYPNKAKLAA
jgi:hypothetical protein